MAAATVLASTAALAVDITISDGTPTLLFDDSDATPPYEWTISGLSNAGATDGNITITSWHSNSVRNILQIDDDTPGALFSNNGLVSLANGTLNVENIFTQYPAVGIGTVSTGASLSILAAVPNIELEDANDGSYASIELGPSYLNFYTGSTSSSTQLPFSVHFDAPDNALTIDAAGNVGLGKFAAEQAVDVQRSAAAARFQLTSFTNTGSEAPQYIQRRARGTSTAPAAVLVDDNLGLFSFRGYNGTTMGGSRATITAQAAGNFTNSSTPTRLIFATTPVGQTTPQQVLVITPDGKVQVNGQNLNVPDYVFEDDYELMPLEELQAFIDSNGHLPGIPSAAEVNSGVHDLAGSDMAQLRKIEELTLYTLELHRRDRQRDALLETLLEENSGLLERLDRLESRLDLPPE
jgi:hypothetical protein